MVRKVGWHRRNDLKGHSRVAVGLKYEEHLRRELCGDVVRQDRVGNEYFVWIVGVELGRDALYGASDLDVGGCRYHAPPFIGNGAGGKDNEVSPGCLLAHLKNEKGSRV